MKNRKTMFTTVLFVLVCFGGLPRAQAVSPAPDGGYPGGNTAEGQAALLNRTTGGFNTAVGFLSLRSDITGSFNTAIGAGTLLANTGDDNTATGAGALLGNTTGVHNTANGVFSLASNSVRGDNTATGSFALQNNTTGDFNTAIGVDALFFNTTGSSNTVAGVDALFHNTTGGGNTAFGSGALASNTNAGGNTAVGYQVLLSNTTGVQNTAIGVSALSSNTAGINNTATGGFALQSNTGASNTAVGGSALQNSTTGSNNVALGFGAGLSVTTASNVICINAQGENVSDTCYIGSIFGATSSGGTAVFINADGQLGTTTSSRRFKEQIKPMEHASEALFALKPVSFHYKRAIDPKGTSQFGLVAEEVEKVNPNLVVRDKQGKAYSVRYDQVNAMLLNEFLKEHKKVEEQEATITQLKTTATKQEAAIAWQQKQIEALTAGMQRVSAQIEMSKATPNVVLNNP